MLIGTRVMVSALTFVFSEGAALYRLNEPMHGTVTGTEDLVRNGVVYHLVKFRQTNRPGCPELAANKVDVSLPPSVGAAMDTIDSLFQVIHDKYAAPVLRRTKTGWTVRVRMDGKACMASDKNSAVAAMRRFLKNADKSARWQRVDRRPSRFE